MIRIDGIRMKIESADIDGDGIINEVESVKSHDKGFMQIKDSTELGEALEHQNMDVDNKRGMNSVDFISRLAPYEIAPMSAVTYISRAGVISGTAKDLVIDIMRKKVSEKGKGRDEFVNVVVGKKEQEIKKGSALVGVSPK